MMRIFMLLSLVIAVHLPVIGVAQETEVSSLPTFFPQERLYGQWVSETPDFSIVFAPSQDPSKPKDNIEGYSTRRIWKGWYEENPLQETRAQLFYLPESDEMNPAIPGWVRRRLDGELEWRLEIAAKGPDHHPHIELKWFRGLVKWDETTRKAEIVGDGEPRVFKLDHSPVLKITQNTPISIRVVPVVVGQRVGSGAPVASVLQQQKFHVELAGPTRLVKTLGRTVNVTIQGEASGATADLELEARIPPEEKGQRVIYTNPVPISLGTCVGGEDLYPPILSIEWMAGVQTSGDCLSFKGIDGEPLRVSYGKAVYRFQWWRNWMSAARARHRDEIERRRTVYAAIVSSPDQSNKAREEARRKLVMIQNYDALMESDRLVEAHKAAIGDIYLGGKGIGQFVRYAGFSTAPGLSPTQGLLSYTEDDWKRFSNRNLRWPSYEIGPYANSLAFFSQIVKWLALDFSYNADPGGNAAKALPTNVNAQLHPDKIDPMLKSRIVWQHRGETIAVSVAIKSVSTGLINEYSEAFFRQGTLMVYDSIAEESGGGFAFLVADWVAENAPAIMHGISEGSWPVLAEARDHRGNPVDGWGVAAIASNFLLNFAVDIDRAYGGYSTLRMYSKAKPGSPGALVKGIPWRTGIDVIEDTTDSVILTRRAGETPTLRLGGDATVRLPSTLPNKVQDQITDTFVAGRLLDDGTQTQKLVNQMNLNALPPAKFLAAPVDLAADGTLKLPPKNAVNAGAGQAEMALPLAATQRGMSPLLIPTNPARTVAAADWGANTQMIDVPGRFGFQQAAHSDGMIAANYAIAQRSGFAASEATGSVQMQNILVNAAGRGEIPPAAVQFFGHRAPYPDAMVNRYLADHGMQAAVLHPSRNRTANLMQAHIAHGKGYTVTARVDMGGPFPREVVINKVVFDGNGVPVQVQIFDPKFGAHMNVDAAVMHERLARNTDVGVFKAVKRGEPDGPPTIRTNIKPQQPLPLTSPGGSAGPALKTPKPLEGQVFEFTPDGFDKPVQINLGAKLGEGSTSTAFAHQSNSNIVVRINNALGDKLDDAAFDNVIRAQQVDDMGRRALGVENLDTTHIEAVPFYGSVTTRDGARVEIVGRARGTPAVDIAKLRARSQMSPEEIAHLDRYLEVKRGDAASPGLDFVKRGEELELKELGLRSFTPQQADAIARATDALNQRGFVILDGHVHNFNLIEVDGRWKVEFIDPGGIVPVKGGDAALARRVQTDILVRTADERAAFATKGNSPTMLANIQSNSIKKIGKDIDFDAFDQRKVSIDIDTLLFKPNIGLEHPEIAAAFTALRP